jgi:NADH-quinone oxidoreductase subunit E
MSVRRLAEDNVQPASFAFNGENAAWAEATIRKYPEGRQQSAVIPLLMRAQEQDGWVTKAAIEYVAQKLGMAYIRVLEVATFYTQFQLKPIGTRAHVQVCGTTPCMLRGAEDLIKVCKSKISANPLELNEDGTLSWEEVECQGACVNAPMVMIFKDAYEDLTPTQLEHIIDRFQAGKGNEITPGPQVDRYFSAPVGGPVTLTGDVKPVEKGLEQKPSPQEAGSAAQVPPSDAGRPKDTAEEADPSIKTPLTDKAGAKKRVKTAQEQPLSATESTPKPDEKSAGSAAEGAPPEPGAVSGDAKPKRTRKKATPEGDAS